MALPLLVPVVVGLAGLFGFGKATQAVLRNSEANGIQQDAAAIVTASEEALNYGKEASNETLRQFGEAKISVLNEEIKRFIKVYSSIKNVTLGPSEELRRLKIGQFSEVQMQELKYTCNFVAEIAGGALKGAGAGALTAFGSYSGTMALASAGTGTAISSLSGAAATNATLAWLGGGTLSAGGLGVAGGTMVLGTLVAGPAMLVLGSVLSARASAKLDDARANLEMAKTYEAEVLMVMEKLKAIIEVAVIGIDLVGVLKSKLNEMNNFMEAVTKVQGPDYKSYNEASKSIVYNAVITAQLLKKVIDTPVLNPDGSLHNQTLIGFQQISDSL